MITQLIDCLAAFDPRDNNQLASFRSQLERIGGGSLFDESARIAFWANVQERNREIGPLILRAYTQLRREGLRQIAKESRGLPKGAFNLHVGLMLLLSDAGEVVEYCFDDVAKLILDADGEIRSVTSKMLAGSPCRRFVPVKTILSAFSKYGVWEYPFSLGEAVVKASRYDDGLAAALIDAVNGDENINSAVMTIIAQLPIDEQQKHSTACRVAKKLDDQSGASALQALSEIGITTPAAEEIVKLAIESDRYHIRAWAAEVAGKLRLTPEYFVPRLTVLLRDIEGHDFTVQECAIRAIGYYGSEAQSSLAELLSLKQESEADDYDLDLVKELDLVISRIRV